MPGRCKIDRSYTISEWIWWYAGRWVMAGADKSKGLSLSGGPLGRRRSLSLAGSRPCARDRSLDPWPCAASRGILLRRSSPRTTVEPSHICRRVGKVSVFVSEPAPRLPSSIFQSNLTCSLTHCRHLTSRLCTSIASSQSTIDNAHNSQQQRSPRAASASCLTLNSFISNCSRCLLSTTLVHNTRSISTDHHPTAFPGCQDTQ